MSVFNRLCCIKDDTIEMSKVLPEVVNSNEILDITIIQSDNICGICISPLQYGTTITELKNGCKHEFCQSCVVTLVRYSKDNRIVISCPLCRAT
jgi:hypothetical protein